MEEEKTLTEFDAFEHPMELELELRDGEEGGEGDNDGDNNSKEADDEDEDEDEEEDDGSGEYKFQFGAEMDPLAFTEEDAFGRQPYQQFEHLEHQYEALAAKKRKVQALPPR